MVKRIGNFLYWVCIIGFGGTLSLCLAPLIIWATGFFHRPQPEPLHGYGLWLRALIWNPSANQQVISYADFVSILLTGISVILAALGFMIAVIALIGWKTLGDHVSAQARAHIVSLLKPGNELHDLVKTEVRAYMYQGVEKVDPDLNDEDGHSVQGDGQ